MSSSVLLFIFNAHWYHLHESISTSQHQDAYPRSHRSRRPTEYSTSTPDTVRTLSLCIDTFTSPTRRSNPQFVERDASMSVQTIPSYTVDRQPTESPVLRSKPFLLGGMLNCLSKACRLTLLTVSLLGFLLFARSRFHGAGCLNARTNHPVLHCQPSAY